MNFKLNTEVVKENILAISSGEILAFVVMIKSQSLTDFAILSVETVILAFLGALAGMAGKYFWNWAFKNKK